MFRFFRVILGIEGPQRKRLRELTEELDSAHHDHLEALHENQRVNLDAARVRSDTAARLKRLVAGMLKQVEQDHGLDKNASRQ